MELLSASDVARELGVSHQYITKLARDGKMPGVHVGRYLLFERPAVETLRERRKKKAAARNGAKSDDATCNLSPAFPRAADRSNPARSNADGAA